MLYVIAGAGQCRTLGVKRPKQSWRMATVTGAKGMGRLIKAVLALALLGFAALVAFTYLAEMTPVTGEVTVPVTLNAD